MRKVFSFLLLICLSFVASADSSDVTDSKWLKNELNLSHEQRKEILNILYEYQPKINELRKSTDASKSDLRRFFHLVVKNQKHNQIMIEKFEAYRDMKNSLQRTKFMMALKIRNVLSRDQIVRLNSLEEAKLNR